MIFQFDEVDHSPAEISNLIFPEIGKVNILPYNGFEPGRCILLPPSFDRDIRRGFFHVSLYWDQVLYPLVMGQCMYDGCDFPSLTVKLGDMSRNPGDVKTERCYSCGFLHRDRFRPKFVEHQCDSCHHFFCASCVRDTATGELGVCLSCAWKQDKESGE